MAWLQHEFVAIFGSCYSSIQYGVQNRKMYGNRYLPGRGFTRRWMEIKVIITLVTRPLDDRIYLLDLRSLLWGFGESCTIVRIITSHPANVLSHVLS